jgi:hypothetical protein
VAFANSCPIGQPGILYVGVDDNGQVERVNQGTDFEVLQKNVSAKIKQAWPPIYFNSHILKKDDLEFIAVVIFGSPKRPHFSGPAFVRVGPESRDASEEQYDTMIAERSSRIRAVRKLIGTRVYWHATTYQPGSGFGIVADCNQFYVTLDCDSFSKSFPIDWLNLSLDSNKKVPHFIITGRV